MRAMLHLLLALVMLAPAAALAEEPLTVMSFNVRLPHKGDGADYWDNRRDLFIATIRKADPDIMGTQELWKIQGDYIVEKLPHWAWFGIDRRGGHKDEHMGVFYRHDRLRLIDFGNFWLSDTPEVVGSETWGHPFPRMVTWGLFERKADGERFYFYNTHFPYREEDEDAREKGAALIARRIAALPADVPVILTGDFNTRPDTPTHAALAATMEDAREEAETVTGPAGTFHGFTGKPGDRIDWIFTRDADVETFETITANRNGRYPSDHFPVVAVMELE